MLSFQDSAKRSRSNAAVAQRNRRNENPFEDFGAPAMFSGDPFSEMRRIMDGMHRMANNMFGEMERGMGSDFRIPEFTGQNYFYSSSQVQTTKYDQSGRPVVERYRNDAYGSGRGENRFAERKQAYSHSGTGLEKYGHERVLGNRAKKTVWKRIGDNENKSELFRNMDERDALEFDRGFDQRLREFGSGRNMLGYERQPQRPSDWRGEFDLREQPRRNNRQRGSRRPARPGILS